nr:MFS transporter [Nakamurella flavida]
MFALGQGAIAPVVVITARQLGASSATAALVVAAAGLGQVLADVPAGALATRFGEKRTMIGAAGLTAVAMAACIWAPTLAVFTGAIFLTGAATAVWLLARQAYLTEVVPFHLRARAMSTLGGVFRIGLFAGPFIGSLVISWVGTAGAYAVQMAAAAAAVIVLLCVRDITGRGGHPPGRADHPPVGTAAAAAAPSAVSTRQVLREHRGVFATMGTAVLLVAAVRAARQVVIPLWGAHLGLDPVTISIVFGISGAVDMLLFYPAGKVMDRFGRIWAAGPSMLVLGIGLVVLPLTSSVEMLTVVGVVMGIGNGIGAGLVMTLAADASPPQGRAVFLGLFRVFADSGNGVGPFVIAGITAVSTLGTGIVAMGVVGLLSAGLLTRWLPRATVGR